MCTDGTDGNFYAFSHPQKKEKGEKSGFQIQNKCLVWCYTTYLDDRKERYFDVAWTSEKLVMVVAQAAENAMSRSKGEAKDRNRPRTPLSLRSHVTKWLDWRAKSVQIDP